MATEAAPKKATNKVAAKLESHLNNHEVTGKRERKTTTVYTVEKTEAKSNVADDIKKGAGEEISTMKSVVDSISKNKGDSEELKFLHKLMFKTAGKKGQIKKNIKAFSGITYGKEEDVKAKIEKAKLPLVKSTMKILLIDADGAKGKEETVEKLAQWLMKPTAPAEKEAKKAAPKKPAAKKTAKKSPAKKTAKKAKKDESEVEDEKEESVDEEKEEADDEEEKEEPVEKKKKAPAKKAPAKKAAPKKAAAKKTEKEDKMEEDEAEPVEESKEVAEEKEKEKEEEPKEAPAKRKVPAPKSPKKAPAAPKSPKAKPAAKKPAAKKAKKNEEKKVEPEEKEASEAKESKEEEPMADAEAKDE